jgi:uncharacterized membrane protein
LTAAAGSVSPLPIFVRFTGRRSGERPLPFELTFFDVAALVWFLAAWAGYNLVFDRALRRPVSLNRHLESLRRAWMERMLERENRIADAALIGHTIHSISFFASTTMIILAGLIGTLGGIERVHGIVMGLTFAAKTGRALFELKMLVLLGVFVYAFFRFTWALRQYNYLCVLIGGAPPGHAADQDAASDIASLLTQAVRSFNAGMRAYYFAVAVLTWFIHPALFMLATFWALAVLLRRQYFSRSFRAIASRAAVLSNPPGGQTPPAVKDRADCLLPLPRP